MRVSVFGLGYVGTVTAACLAKEGHTVVGVDVNSSKVQKIEEGQTPISEPRIDEIIQESREQGRLRATTRADEALSATDLSLVCVGTPSMKSGRLDLSGVEQVSHELGRALQGKKTFHTFVIRSTTLPGTVETMVAPAIEKTSGRKLGSDFAVCYNPEFLREGTAVRDFYAPPFTVIGAKDPAHAKPVADLYGKLDSPVFHTEIRTAEMLKYSCNAFHALKIAFANELGTLANASGVDSHALMQLFCSDTKLNLSRAYLEPGFAFGGSCLPKDIRAMLYRAKELDLKLPVLESVLPSNDLHLARAVDLILGTKKKRIGVLGLSFKADTDDLRESPMVGLVKALLGEGCQIRIHDRRVELSAIFGSNRQFIEATIPHIGALLDPSLEHTVKEAEVVVLGRDAKEFEGLKNLLTPAHIIVELTRSGDLEGIHAKQIGLCW
jgi:GDP-mannose 6-dehydrogenase